MPITPRYANVIAFFGGNSLTRLESMLRYYSTILSEDVWQNFLFILATPGSQGVSALPADLPKHIRERCCDGCGDPRFVIYQQTASRIHSMYRDGMLNLHLICDDFETGLFPAEAPADLVKVLRQATHINITPYYYCLLHARDAAKTRRQRQLVQRLSEGQQQGDVLFPYLLSIEQDDNSLAQPEQLWRAVMCEILVIAQGRRHINSGTLSSLGYTSLNADEKELVNLRREHLLELLHATCTAPYPQSQAWQDLLRTPEPMPENAMEAQNRVRQWLQNRIREDMSAPSQHQMNNFRVLSGVFQMQEPNALFGLAKKFFQINLHSRNAALTAQENKKPEYLSAEKYLRELLARLSQRPNLGCFPQSVLKLITDSLAALLTYTPRAAYLSYPKKTFMQQNRVYMLRCSEIAENEARRQIVEELIPAYARAYGEMFVYLGKQLKNASAIGAMISKLMLPTDRIAQLREKYPGYDQDIENTLNRCQEQLFGDVRFYDPAGASPNAEKISAALLSADATVLDRMSAGYRSSFISAIRHEFSTSAEMENFLGNYLSNKRMMFHNILESAGTPVITYFSNDQLSSSNWAQTHKERTFFVRNDNVERLDYFPLQRRLGDYLAPDFQTDEHNEYFWVLEEEVIIDLPDAPMPQDSGEALPSAPLSYPHQDAAAEREAPAGSSLRLIESYDQLLLTWDWDAQVPFYRVTINGKPYDINANSYYMSHGMNITDKLVPGRNQVILSVLHGPVIASEELCGPQTYIDYKKTPSALITAYSPSAVSSLVVRETLRSRNRMGEEIRSYFYYPLASIEPMKGQSVVRYEGLVFAGEWELVSTPGEQFSKYAPRLNPNL